MFEGLTTRLSEATIDSKAIIDQEADILRVRGNTTIQTIRPNFGGHSGICILVPVNGTINLGTSGNILAAVSITLGSAILLTYDKVKSKWTPALVGSGGGGGFPSPHAFTHELGGTDEVHIAESQVINLVTDLAGKVSNTDPRLTDARTPLAHNTTHSSGGSDPIIITALGGFPADPTKFLRGDATFAAPPGGGGGGGDVFGPASSVDNHLVLFSGTTGKSIKDAGLTVSIPQNLTLIDGVLTAFGALLNELNVVNAGPAQINFQNSINAADQKKWVMQVLGDGAFRLVALTDAGAPQASFVFNKTGNIALPSYVVQSGPDVATHYIRSDAGANLKRWSLVPEPDGTFDIAALSDAAAVQKLFTFFRNGGLTIGGNFNCGDQTLANTRFTVNSDNGALIELFGNGNAVGTKRLWMQLDLEGGLRIVTANDSGTSAVAFMMTISRAGVVDVPGILTVDGGKRALAVTGGFPGGTTTFLRADGTFATPAGGGGATKPFICWTANRSQPPATIYATLALRNAHPILEFDATIDEEAVFADALPLSYAGGGLTVEIYYVMATATTGSVRWQAAFERDDTALNISADDFAAFQSVGGTVPSPAGQIAKLSILFTSGSQMDGILAGENFRLKIRRDADQTSGTDDATGDAQLLRVICRET